MIGSIFKYLILTLVFNILCARKVSNTNESFVPIVLWHGMGKKKSIIFVFKVMYRDQWRRLYR